MEKWNLKGAKFFNPKEAEKNVKKDTRTGSRRRTTVAYELSTSYLYRRAFSETQLRDAIDFNYEYGHSYHFITGGDVDSLSFLKSVLRQQDLEYVLFSTWVMNAEDILQLDQWVEAGKIKKMDAFLGEIFPKNFRIEWQMLNDLFAHHQCGRAAFFKNHLKCFAGYGKKFPFVIETSANINSNARTEAACITIDQGFFDFYKKFFDGIISFQ